MKIEFSYNPLTNKEPLVKNEFDVVQFETVTPEVSSEKTLPQGLGDMNRLTKDGRAIILAQGHSKNSFKRNYETGTATYFCRTCSATLNVSIHSSAGITGTVLEKRCTETPKN